MKLLRIVIHGIAISLLTILTQIGGLVYVIALFAIKRNSRYRRVKVIGVFLVLYLFATYLIIPILAPLFGREKIKNSPNLSPHSHLYVLSNRNYVRPELNKLLQRSSDELDHRYPGIKTIYLDANFPFFNGFPLLPHLSHNDGKKIDLSFVYRDAKGEITNLKPTVSGYGDFVNPLPAEFNQTEACKRQGYFQYDMAKYMTMGKLNSDLSLSEDATGEFIRLLLDQETIGKIFIEPHLKNRMNLNNDKIRFHGCRAVRHDDHIHIQLR